MPTRVQSALRPPVTPAATPIPGRPERVRRGAGPAALGLAVLYLILQAADVWTTALGRTMGVPERNPLAALVIAQHGWATMVLRKLIGAAAGAAVALLISRVERRIGLVLLLALCGQMAVLVALNVATLQPLLPALPVGMG